jgi:hypothetical protein
VFTWLNKQGVRSSEGFEVQFTGRFCAEYREGGRVLTIGVESGTWGGTTSINVAANAFERWDNSRTINSAQEQQRLRANFMAALLFQGLALEPV